MYLQSEVSAYVMLPLVIRFLLSFLSVPFVSAPVTVVVTLPDDDEGNT